MIKIQNSAFTNQYKSNKNRVINNNSAFNQIDLGQKKYDLNILTSFASQKILSSSLTVNKTSRIAFEGAGLSKNPNQVLLVSTECWPIAAEGGMANVNYEEPLNVKKQNPDLDIRILIPAYNSSKGPKLEKTENGEKLYFKDSKGKKLEVKDTGIKSDFSHGVVKSGIKVYELVDNNGDFVVDKNNPKDDPENKITVYLAHIPETAKMKKQYDNTYQGDHNPNLFNSHAALSMGVLAFLKKAGTNDKVGFNPQMVRTTDWHTAILNANLKQMVQEDDFFKGIAVPNTIHNGGPSYQGKINPFQALLYAFTEKQVKETLKLDEVKEILKEIKREENFKGSDLEFLQKVAADYNRYDVKYKSQITEMEDYMREYFINGPWDKDDCYNPVQAALESADISQTVSVGYRGDLAKSSIKSGNLDDKYREISHKFIGITNGTDVSMFDSLKSLSDDPEKGVKYTYSSDPNSFVPAKKMNKEYLQQNVQGLGLKIGNKETKVIGSLKRDPQAPLVSMAGRYDTQKGIDFVMKAAEELLKKHKNLQLILGGPGFDDPKHKEIDEFEKVIKKYPGQIAMVKGKITSMQQLLAGSDMFLVPSRFEPCGLTQLQAERMGALPIVARTGGLDETIRDPEDDGTIRPNGFKTAEDLEETEKNPVNLLADTIDRALESYKNKDVWNKMVVNAMTEESSWDKPAQQYREHIYENPALSELAIKLLQ